MTRHGEPLDFIRDVLAEMPSACRPWPFSKSVEGYGRVRFEGRMRRAAHVTLIMSGQPQPDPSFLAAHKPLICHNPSCITPAHLRWATPQENVLDKLIDGTASDAFASRRATMACVRGHVGSWRRRSDRPDSWGCQACHLDRARARAAQNRLRGGS